MSIRDLNVPYWLIAFILALWGVMLILYARLGRRLLDIGAGARSVPRFYLAAYYATLWLAPGTIPTDVAHVMGRWGLMILATSDVSWFLADEWLARRDTITSWLAKLLSWLPWRRSDG